MADPQQKILGAWSDDVESEVVQVAKDLVAIPSPTGHEQEIADYLAWLFADLGMRVDRQEVEPGRENVIATAEFGPDSRSLMFNAHMDSSTSGTERADLPIGLVPSPTVEDGWLYGLGVSNMKAAFAAYCGALMLLRAAGVELDGRLLVSGVVGEIEKAPVGRYQGPEFRGGGCGAAYGAQHGMMADIVVIGEPTGMRIQNGSSSYAFCRVSSSGRAQHTWSRERGEDALSKSVILMEALRAWEPEFQRIVGGDKVGARLTVSAIEGGYPYKPSIAPAPYCDLYLDLRFPRETSAVQVRRIVHDRLRELAQADQDLSTSLEFYLVRNGFDLPENDPLFQRALRAHHAATGQRTGAVQPERYFVSADASTFTEYGMKCLVYGPGGITRDGTYQMYDDRGEVVSLENVMTCARSYALLAAETLGAGH